MKNEENEKGGVARAAIEMGLESGNQLAEISTVSLQTLYNWSKNKPVLFNVVMLGAIKQLEIDEDEEWND